MEILVDKIQTKAPIISQMIKAEIKSLPASFLPLQEQKDPLPSGSKENSHVERNVDICSGDRRIWEYIHRAHMRTPAHIDPRQKSGSKKQKSSTVVAEAQGSLLANTTSCY